MGTNLHAVWDYYLLATPRLPARAYADRLATAPWPPKTSASQDPARWAVESCRLAKGVYPPTHAMDRAYLDQQRPLAELRSARRPTGWRHCWTQPSARARSKSMHPEVAAFLHADSNTWSYVASDPATCIAAIIDPVLDFDAKSGRTATSSAQALLDHAGHMRSTCAGCWKPTPTPIISARRIG